MDPNAQVTDEPLINLAVSGWRFAKSFERVISKLDAGEQSKHAGQLRFFLRGIEDALSRIGCRLVVLDGQDFDTGLPVNAINLAEFQSQENLVIDQTYEPVVMGTDGVIRMGSVVLRSVVR